MLWRRVGSQPETDCDERNWAATSGQFCRCSPASSIGLVRQIPTRLAVPSLKRWRRGADIPSWRGDRANKPTKRTQEALDKFLKFLLASPKFLTSGPADRPRGPEKAADVSPGQPPCPRELRMTDAGRSRLRTEGSAAVRGRRVRPRPGPSAEEMPALKPGVNTTVTESFSCPCRSTPISIH